jgi:hypothetical protein
MRRLLSGAGGARTRGLERATLALSQLSYGPRVPQCSAELVVLGPVDPRFLVVAGGSQSKLNVRSPVEAIEREEELALVSVD